MAAPTRGSGSDRRTLGRNSRHLKRQIQLTAVYNQKSSRRFAGSRDISLRAIQFDYQLCCRTAFRRADLDGATESAVHRLLHRRMTAKQQMRWSPRGAHFMLKVRTSVMNGTFEQDHIALANRRAAATSCRITPPTLRRFSAVDPQAAHKVRSWSALAQTRSQASRGQ